MKYIKHYEIDNEKMNYDSLSPNEKGKMFFRFNLIKKMIGKNSGKILDIGSANGFIGNIIHGDFISLDISQINNTYSSVKIEGDALFLPFKNNSFSTVIISETLEHIVNPKQAIDEIKRILIPKGLLILSIPFNERISKTLCIHCNNLTPVNAHLHSFNLKSLKNLLKESGLSINKYGFYENKILEIFHFYSLYNKLPFSMLYYFDTIAKICINKYNKLIVKIIKGQ
ncbi:class I SAM-dependent methyltransferase [candidate division WOR-3 bacterium]|nr:class I SAM-dependent methyltransferase [candidate division WOR-3 bacterium]